MRLAKHVRRRRIGLAPHVRPPPRRRASIRRADRRNGARPRWGETRRPARRRTPVRSASGQPASRPRSGACSRELDRGAHPPRPRAQRRAAADVSRPSAREPAVAAAMWHERTNRGLRVCWEMTRCCGGQAEVRHRVDRMIDEQTRQMREICNTATLRNIRKKRTTMPDSQCLC